MKSKTVQNHSGMTQAHSHTIMLTLLSLLASFEPVLSPKVMKNKVGRPPFLV